MTFDRLVRKPAYYTVADSIRQKIVSGELAQDSYLPPENDFADQLGVTRQTLREAVRLLETSGLITRGKRRRLMVARPSSLAVSGSLLEAMVLHEVTYREILELHLVMDPGVAALAASKATPEDRARLDANMVRMAKAVEAGDGIVEADTEFHMLVMHSTHNVPLRLAHEANTDVLYSTFSGLAPALEAWQAKRILAAHQRILDAIKRRDAEEARTWMTKHLEDIQKGARRMGVDLDERFVTA